MDRLWHLCGGLEETTDSTENLEIYLDISRLLSQTLRAVVKLGSVEWHIVSE